MTLALTIEDDSAQEESRWVTIGMNSFGMLMVVVWTDRDDDVRLISVSRSLKSGGAMKREYDFSRGKRGAVLPTRGKTRITIYLDDEIVQRFKTESERTGKGYQTLINEALALSKQEAPLTASQVRKIVREELEGISG
jgi:uncharacterized protein (DUF4415 family)